MELGPLRDMQQTSDTLQTTPPRKMTPETKGHRAAVAAATKLVNSARKSQTKKLAKKTKLSLKRSATASKKTPLRKLLLSTDYDLNDAIEFKGCPSFTSIASKQKREDSSDGTSRKCGGIVETTSESIQNALKKEAGINPIIHAANGTVQSTGGCMHKGVKSSSESATHRDEDTGASASTDAKSVLGARRCSVSIERMEMVDGVFSSPKHSLNARTSGGDVPTTKNKFTCENGETDSVHDAPTVTDMSTATISKNTKHCSAPESRACKILKEANKSEEDGGCSTEDTSLSQSFHTCPKCGETCPRGRFVRHMKRCVTQQEPATSEGEDDAREKRETAIPEDVRSTKEEEVLPTEYLFCQICQKDLSHVNSHRRTIHINSCIDKDESLKKEEEERKQALEAARDQILDCPMCGKVLKTDLSRKAHLKNCAKTLGVETKQLLKLVSQQKQEHLARIAAGVLPPLYRAGRKPSHGSSTGQRKRVTSIPKSKLDEDTQLALALSASVNTEGAATTSYALGDGPARRGRKQLQEEDYLLHQLTSEQAATRIQSRVSDHIMQQDLEDDTEIIPTLPSARPDRLRSECLRQVLSCNSEVSLRKMFWGRTSLDDQTDNTAQAGPDARRQFYVPVLMPPVKISTVIAGSKVRQMSEIPGRRRSFDGSTKQEEDEESWSSEDEGPPVPSTQTAALLAEMAAEADEDHRVEQGSFSTSPRQKIRDVVAAYASLVNRHDFSDIQIRAADGVVLYAHRIILYARCPKLLQLAEIGSGSADLTDWSPECVLAVLRFVYAGCTDFDADMHSVLNLADRLGLTDLTASVGNLPTVSSQNITALSRTCKNEEPDVQNNSSIISFNKNSRDGSGGEQTVFTDTPTEECRTTFLDSNLKINSPCRQEQTPEIHSQPAVVVAENLNHVDSFLTTRGKSASKTDVFGKSEQSPAKAADSYGLLQSRGINFHEPLRPQELMKIYASCDKPTAVEDDAAEVSVANAPAAENLVPSPSDTDFINIGSSFESEKSLKSEVENEVQELVSSEHKPETNMDTLDHTVHEDTHSSPVGDDNLHRQGRGSQSHYSLEGQQPPQGQQLSESQLSQRKDNLKSVSSDVEDDGFLMVDSDGDLFEDEIDVSLLPSTQQLLSSKERVPSGKLDRLDLNRDLFKVSSPHKNNVNKEGQISLSDRAELCAGATATNIGSMKSPSSRLSQKFCKRKSSETDDFHSETDAYCLSPNTNPIPRKRRQILSTSTSVGNCPSFSVSAVECPDRTSHLSSPASRKFITSTPQATEEQASRTAARNVDQNAQTHGKGNEAEVSKSWTMSVSESACSSPSFPTKKIDVRDARSSATPSVTKSGSFFSPASVVEQDSLYVTPVVGQSKTRRTFQLVTPSQSATSLEHQQFQRQLSRFSPSVRLHRLSGSEVENAVSSKKSVQNERNVTDSGADFSSAESECESRSVNSLVHAATGTVNSTDGCMHKGVKDFSDKDDGQYHEPIVEINSDSDIEIMDTIHREAPPPSPKFSKLSSSQSSKLSSSQPTALSCTSDQSPPHLHLCSQSPPRLKPPNRASQSPPLLQASFGEQPPPELHLSNLPTSDRPTVRESPPLLLLSPSEQSSDAERSMESQQLPECEQSPPQSPPQSPECELTVESEQSPPQSPECEQSPEQSSEPVQSPLQLDLTDVPNSQRPTASNSPPWLQPSQSPPPSHPPNLSPPRLDLSSQPASPDHLSLSSSSRLSQQTRDVNDLNVGDTREGESNMLGCTESSPVVIQDDDADEDDGADVSVPAASPPPDSVDVWDDFEDGDAFSTAVLLEDNFIEESAGDGDVEGCRLESPPARKADLTHKLAAAGNRTPERNAEDSRSIPPDDVVTPASSQTAPDTPTRSLVRLARHMRQHLASEECRAKESLHKKFCEQTDNPVMLKSPQTKAARKYYSGSPGITRLTSHGMTQAVSPQTRRDGTHTTHMPADCSAGKTDFCSPQMSHRKNPISHMPMDCSPGNTHCRSPQMRRERTHSSPSPLDVTITLSPQRSPLFKTPALSIGNTTRSPTSPRIAPSTKARSLDFHDPNNVKSVTTQKTFSSPPGGFVVEDLDDVDVRTLSIPMGLQPPVPCTVPVATGPMGSITPSTKAGSLKKHDQSSRKSPATPRRIFSPPGGFIVEDVEYAGMEDEDMSFLWAEENAPDAEVVMPGSVQNTRLEPQPVSLSAVTPKVPRQAPKTGGMKAWVPPSPFTPMPAYDDMATPDLKREVQKYGLKPVGKKRMRGVLKDIYHKTHQYETDSECEDLGASSPLPDGISKQTYPSEMGTERASKPKKASSAKQGKSSAAQPSQADAQKSKKTKRGLAKSSPNGKQTAKKTTTKSAVSDSSKEQVTAKKAGANPNASDSALAQSKSKKTKRGLAAGTTTATGQSKLSLAPQEAGASNKEGRLEAVKKTFLRVDSCASDWSSSPEKGSMSSSQDSNCSERPDMSVYEEAGGDEDEDITPSQAGGQDLKETLMKFIQARPALHVQVLTYEPLDLAVFKADLKAAGVRCSHAKLLDFLDEMCITFTTKNMVPLKRRNRGKKNIGQKTKKTAASQES